MGNQDSWTNDALQCHHNQLADTVYNPLCPVGIYLFIEVARPGEFCRFFVLIQTVANWQTVLHLQMTVVAGLRCAGDEPSLIPDSTAMPMGLPEYS